MSKRKVNASVVKSFGSSFLTSAHEPSGGKEPGEAYVGSDLIEPPYPLTDLYRMTEYSTILGQCIESYKRNITGYGIGINYNVDESQEGETAEMKAEKVKVEFFIKAFNFDKSFEELSGDVITDREKTGNGYMEIIRDSLGKIAGGDRLDPRTMRLTTLGSFTDVEVEFDGVKSTRPKKFRKYVQIINNGVKKTWFKELGDPRYMKASTGEYTDSHNGQDEATEVLHLKIGQDAYGVPRWIAQVLHMYGARKAEELNYRYFQDGRHTPLAVIVQNGMLTEESHEQLKEYANGVQGVQNSHKFLLLEVEGMETGLMPGDEKISPVRVELKSLADMLQKDALFLEYDDSSRMKVQSAFRLPDIYVGRSADYNRATADKARQVTEEQVFEPERNSLEWIINNKLLKDLELCCAYVDFKTPEINDPQDQARLLDVIGRFGGITPNDLRETAADILGKPLDLLDIDDANLPMAIANSIRQQAGGINLPKVLAANEIDNQDVEEVQKIISLLKDIRDEVEENGKTIRTT